MPLQNKCSLLTRRIFDANKAIVHVSNLLVNVLAHGFVFTVLKIFVVHAKLVKNFIKL